MLRRRFTLVELMVVVAILGMLAAAVGVNVIQRFITAQQATVQSDFKTIVDGLKLYRLDNGRYPRELSALWEPPANAPRWKGPYVEPCPVIDPWGTPYAYRQVDYGRGRDFQLTSLGADGQPGGADEDADIEYRVE